MAERPIFIPQESGPQLAQELSIGFKWHPGFAAVQKKKNILALHESAKAKGYFPLLEVSTKSELPLGRRLSAFNLKVKSDLVGEIPLESAFQGSKEFEGGGPYTELYSCDAKTARQDIRLRNSGRLTRFQFNGQTFPNEPKTAFYDWLYITAIFPQRDLQTSLREFAGFTDIEFNPERSINCQARSCAIFVAMIARNILDKSVESPRAFIETVASGSIGQSHSLKDS